jgi:hypothetical protein
MSRYQILIPDEYLQMGLQWPPGTKLVEQLERGTAGTHWYLFDDPDAPGDLEGKQVELRLERGRKSEDEPEGDNTPRVAWRRVIVTHLVPQDDSGEMACCGVPAWEVPRSDRITANKDLVSCGGAA